PKLLVQTHQDADPRRTDVCGSRQVQSHRMLAFLQNLARRCRQVLGPVSVEPALKQQCEISLLLPPRNLHEFAYLGIRHQENATLRVPVSFWLAWRVLRRMFVMPFECCAATPASPRWL